MEVDPIHGLPLLPTAPPDPTAWEHDPERAHELALADDDERRGELARAETLAAADWPDHAYDWSEAD